MCRPHRSVPRGPTLLPRVRGGCSQHKAVQCVHFASRTTLWLYASTPVPPEQLFFSRQETRARKFEARVLGRRPLQPHKKWLQAQRMSFKMQKLRALIREEVDKARATRTRATVTTQSSTPRPVVAPEEEAAPAPRARETDAPAQHQPCGTTTEAALAAAAAGTKARSTTTSRAPRQANTAAGKAASASRARENDHVHLDRDAAAPRARQL